MTERHAILTIAKDAALAAGALMLSERNAPKRIQAKASDVDLVTHVDLACDALICEKISAAFPGHLLLTEETYQKGSPIFERMKTEPCWIVDPIDGTTNYAHGFPHSAVSIAYAEHGEPIVGVIYDPFKQELFHAVKNEGAFLNDEKIHASETSDLSKALVATGFAFRREANPDYDAAGKYLMNLLRATRDVRRAGSAALDLAYVACGRLDAFFESHLAPWDVAAGIVLIHEAGGTTSKPNDSPLDMTTLEQNIVATNRCLHSRVLNLL